MWVTGIGSGQLADWMRENNVLSTGEVRKVLATGGECFNLPLTYFHVRIVFNPPCGKRWRLYIFPQFLSNLIRPKWYFLGAGGGGGWAKLVPVIAT